MPTVSSTIPFALVVSEVQLDGLYRRWHGAEPQQMEKKPSPNTIFVSRQSLQTQGVSPPVITKIQSKDPGVTIHILEVI